MATPGIHPFQTVWCYCGDSCFHLKERRDGRGRRELAEAKREGTKPVYERRRRYDCHLGLAVMTE